MRRIRKPGGKAGESGRVSSVEKAAARLAGGKSAGAGAAETALVEEHAGPVPPQLPPAAPPSANPPPVATAPAAAAYCVPRTVTKKHARIDVERMRTEGMVTAHEERTNIAEEFRLIKRPLLLKAMEKGPTAVRNGNLIMVTSSSPDEGKTFCTISLAMSIASERDLTVLLVDADVAKPDVPNAMGFEAGLGLVDLMADHSLDVSDVLIKTDLPNLTILPAGRPHHLSTELLASERMERFVQDIANRYSDRIIIFDSPPVLMSSVASVMALHVGQILFVVEAERTTKSALDTALSLVNSCSNISLLLNKARAGGSEKFGSYNYYYR